MNNREGAYGGAYRREHVRVELMQTNRSPDELDGRLPRGSFKVTQQQQTHVRYS